MHKDDNNKIYGVLTGDIIESGSIQKQEDLTVPEMLTKVANQAKEKFPQTILYNISIFRGDSWQIVLQKPSQALRLALFIRAALISFSTDLRIDTRIGIGIGKVDYIPEKNLTAGNGEAFLLSGEALEEIGSNRFMHLRYFNTQKQAFLNIILGLIDTISTNWSSKQALAVKGALQGLKQKEIAELWDPSISQQTVTRHLRRAGWENLEQTIQFFEKTI